MRIVRLWDICSPMLIVQAATGVIYENQTWGTHCYHDSLEGILIPISNDYYPDEYHDSLDYRLSALFPEGSAGYIDEATSTEIARILKTYPETQGIHVHWEKLSSSHEAWLHVLLNDVEMAPYSGFDNREAVLTWRNSD